MSTSLIYGCKLASLQEVRVKLEEALGLAFQERDSSYIGIYFVYYENDIKLLELRENVDPLDDEPFLPEFATYKSLLHVNQGPTNLGDVAEALKKLDEFVLLKSG
jgi:hypothetical protein